MTSDPRGPAQDGRTCERCSHLRGEHARTVLVDGAAIVAWRGPCDCCDCEGFVPEPDDSNEEAAA